MRVPASFPTRSGLLILAVLGAAAAVRGVRPAPTSPADAAGSHARYGAAVTMGNGQARTYVVMDER